MTILDMRRRKVETINDIIDEIHKQFAEALSSDQKAHRARLYAGQLLVGLRERFESGEMAPATDWWKWYKENFVRSRKDAEKVMRIASSDNPEAAAEDERAKGRARDNARNGARSRSNKKQLDTDPVDHLLHLVDQLDAEQRQRFLAEIRRRYDD